MTNSRSSEGVYDKDNTTVSNPTTPLHRYHVYLCRKHPRYVQDPRPRGSHPRFGVLTISNRIFREKPSFLRKRLPQSQARTKFSLGSGSLVSIPSTSAVCRPCSVLSERVFTISSRTTSPRARYPAHKYFPSEGAYVGCDFAGEVVKLGPNLQVDLKIGDRVSATVAGSKYSDYSCFPKGVFLASETPVS